MSNSVCNHSCPIGGPPCHIREPGRLQFATKSHGVQPLLFTSRAAAKQSGVGGTPFICGSAFQSDERSYRPVGGAKERRNVDPYGTEPPTPSLGDTGANCASPCLLASRHWDGPDSVRAHGAHPCTTAWCLIRTSHPVPPPPFFFISNV